MMNKVRKTSDIINIFQFDEVNNIVKIVGTTGSEYVRYISNGNMLVGLSIDAGYKLDVAGTFRTSGQVTLSNYSNGFLRVNGSGVVSTDTNTYLTENQSISLTGDVTGSGTTSITTSITAATVTGKVLTGYTVGANTAVAATDTILGAIQKLQGQVSAREGTIASGTSTQYWRGDKSWQTLDTSAVTENTNLYYTDARVRAAVLTGYAVGANTVVAATDTVLSAIQKLQGQVNSKENTLAAGTSTQYYRGDKSWQTLNTDAVTEGTTNLYYTQTRVRGSVSATGSISYNSSTGQFSYTQPTNVSTFTNDSGYYSDSSYGKLASIRANHNLTGGGLIAVDASYNISWGTRFIAISTGNGSNFSTSGYFDITMPANATVITGVGGAANVTVTNGKIALALWQALYYILPIGSTFASNSANFRIATYTAAMDVPYNWVLIALRNGDTNSYVKFGNGIQLNANQSYTVGVNSDAFVPNSDQLDGYHASSFVLANAAITGGTYTKITYDAKGLVTAGSAATTTDIGEGTNLYFTNARAIGAALTGYAVGSNTALAATDTILAAFGKLEAQIASKQATGSYELTANKGVANGYASLDSGGKVPSAQLPSFVDDVLEYANLAGFPATGETGKIYVALDTNKTYRWSGSAYVEISASPGSTDAVTEGSTNKYFTEARVLATVLTGYAVGTNAALAATDSVLTAMGKLQAQINGKQASGTYLTANQSITLSGDVSGTGTTAITTTIGANKVTNSMLRQSAGVSVIGRSANSTGDVADIAASADNQVLRRSGGVLGFGTIDIASIGSGTLAIANGGTGTATAPTQYGVIYATSTTAYGSTGAGSAGQYLMANAGSAPTWANISITDLSDSPLKKIMKVATTGNLTATYANGTSGVGATLTNSSTLAALTIDGVALAANDRVLVKDQTTGTQNGVYIVTNAGSASVAWVLTRATKSDTIVELARAILVVDQGTSNAGKTFLNKNKSTDVIGTSTITFVEVADAVNTITLTNKTLSTGSTWNGNTIGTTYGGTGLSSIGSANQMIRVNSGATALEYFTPSWITGLNVKNNGTSIGTRPAINFIPGTNVTFTVSDDSTNNDVDITINAASNTTVTTVTSAYTGTLGPATRVQQINGYYLGSFGDLTPHVAYADFNTTPAALGWSFVTGQSNSPHTSTQGGYRLRVGLGSDYTNYGMELNITRFSNANSDKYIYARQMESGAWGAWTKISSGFADQAGQILHTSAPQWSNGTITRDLAYKTIVSDFNTITGFQFLQAVAGDTANQPVYNSWGQGFQVSANMDSGYANQFVADYATGNWYSRTKYAGTWGSWRTMLDSSNYSSYAVPLSGGTMTGALNINNLDSSIVVQNNGTGAGWRGRILSKNATANVTSFLGNYNSKAGIFAHTNALDDWAPLYVNTLGSNGMGKVVLSNNTVVQANNSDTEYAIIHAGNYTSYSPSVNGVGAQGTWDIDVSVKDIRDATPTPDSFTGKSAGFRFTNMLGGTWRSYMYVRGWQGEYTTWRLIGPSNAPTNDDKWYLQGGTSSSWGTQHEVLHSSNYSSYAVPLSGGTMTGALGATSFGTTNTSPSSGVGISLYGGTWPNQPPYGISFSGTSTYGTHGSVTGDWATYFTISGATNRGWIFSLQGGPVASIAGNGSASFNTSVSTTDFYATGWYRNYNTQGMYNETYYSHFYAGGPYWNMTSTGASAVEGGLQFRATHGTAVKGYTYWNSAGFGLLNDNGNWIVRGNYQSSGLGGQLYGSWYTTNMSSDIYNLSMNPVGSYRANNTTPSYYIGQNMADNDAWMIYGEGPSSNNGGLVFELRDDGAEYIVMRYKQSSGGGTANAKDIYFYNTGIDFNTSQNAAIYMNGNTKFRLDTNGDFYAYNDIIGFATTTLSDGRFKTNIQKIESPMDKILRLNGVSFEWITEMNRPGREVGMIAQDVEEVLPELVHEKDTLQGKMKTVDYPKMVALLIEGMKEQQQQIETLKSEINELKSKA